MENMINVLGLIKKNCYMASIDLKDAYFTVNVDQKFRKYLRFYWNNQLYEFIGMPNGLTSAPREFTKILKPIFAKLRTEGYVSVYYLDDTWLMGTSKEECELNVERTCQELTSCGFIINVEKSAFEPSQQIQFLGFCIDSVTMKITLPTEKKIKIKVTCQEILLEKMVTIRSVAKVIGNLVACFPAVEHGELFYRYLEMAKVRELKNAKGNFDSKMALDQKSIDEVKWWIKNIENESRNIQRPPVSLTITTDASMSGWGAVFGSNTTGGEWTESEKNSHINVLELQAVFFGLKSFLDKSTNEHIRIRCDNMTAVTYLNKKGGIKSLECHEISKNIWLWAIDRSNYISAEHLPGSQNTIADKASRVFDKNTEWELDNKVFTKIEKTFGPLTIDLFASRLNSKLKDYVSWKPDPNAQFVDAFQLSWNELKFYAFPPFSMILNCLQKIQLEGGTGVIVTPVWNTQSWFPKLLQMLIATPMILPLDVLKLPFDTAAKHQKHKTLRLMACLISGNTTLTKDFLGKQPTLSAHPGENQHPSSMKFILGNGIYSASNKKLIPCNLMK